MIDLKFWNINNWGKTWICNFSSDIHVRLKDKKKVIIFSLFYCLEFKMALIKINNMGWNSFPTSFVDYFISVVWLGVK